MKQQISSHQFPDIYKELKIDLNELGCIMLDAQPIKIVDKVENGDEDLYVAKNKKYWWVNGAVGQKTAHITLLYGLLEQGKKWKKHVDVVLDGWALATAEVEEVGFFESRVPDEKWFTIVAHIKVTDKLLEGHQRLQLLPHIDTFTGYKPHVTLAYIEHDDDVRDKWIEALNDEFKGKKFRLKKGVNYGGKDTAE